MKQTVSFWRSFGVALLCWTASGLIQGCEMFVNDRDQANYLPYAHYFVWAGAEAYSWAILTPFLFAFARRFPFDRGRWFRRLLQYALLTGAIVLVRPLLTGLGWFYTPDQHESFRATVLHLGNKEMPIAIQITLLLYLLAAYQNARREARWRELNEAELRARVSNAELQMLRMQLHPHFLFNSLQAATVLVREDPTAAENLLQRLSELLRVALDDMRSHQVPLQQELVFLQHYIEIQKQRFQDRLSIRMDIADDALPVPVPSLLLQPLVENAIHHGIGRHKGSDIVEVTARRHEQELLIEIRNFASSLGERPEGSGHGVGLKNTRARLEQMYGDQAALKLTSLQPNGVCATVTLPVEMTT